MCRNEQDMQRTYKRNTEARACDHCCRGNAISISYSECVSVALVIRHSKRVRPIVIYGLSGCVIFSHNISQTARFSKQETILNAKCTLILSTACAWNINHSTKNSARYHKYTGARGGVVGWGTAVQIGRSRIRFPMMSLEFFIYIILPAALWPWGWLSL